tara:strand:+ start:2297 stop:3037 length:741 start_codon:yes stop_codon:yes gene_type:complete
VIILCLDIGNTSVSYCEIDNNNHIQSIKRLSRTENVLQFFNNYDIQNINQIIISSVVPDISKQLIENFKIKKINVFEITYRNCGINLKVADSSEVGNDRICNVAGAKKLYGGECIVIDFGTATTYDIMDEEGSFLGGAIAPGIDVSADNLISKASLLKETIYKFPESIIGNSTESNIQSGVMFSGLYSVKGMINHIIDEADFSNPDIILTGGFGKLISNQLDIKHIYNESLTIEGMIEIYQRANNN